MTQPVPVPSPLTLRLPDAGATADLARWFAPRLGPGDVLLLEGPIGAGKTHFARSLIQSLMAADGAIEDVPSPTFTLVQTYEAGGQEIWHADLYRLTSPTEALELGLDEAFDTAICLIEWPDRLADLAPQDALWLSFVPDPAGDARLLTLRSGAGRWAPLLHALAEEAAR